MDGADLYYSEREKGVAPACQSNLSASFAQGFSTLVRRLSNDGSFAEDFPERCFEAPLPVDCDSDSLWAALDAEIPEFSWPEGNDPPETLPTLDAVEFFAQHVSKVSERSYHDYARHHHFLRFDRDTGRREYAEAVNRLFRRNRHPYELGDDGKVYRTAPEVLEQSLATELRTGDEDLDRLISTAIEKFQDPDLEVRKESLEKLWDAWERLKTLLDTDKKAGAEKLLESAVACPVLRTQIAREARWLSEIGNQFRIRHSETDKTPIERDIDVDYLFQRMYSALRLLVRGMQA